MTTRARAGYAGALVPFAFFLAAIVCSAPFALAQGPPAGYYDTVDPSTSTTLRTTLNAVIDDHLRFPYTSSGTDTWDVLELADADAAAPGNIRTIYKNASYASPAARGSIYNREHTWPKSYGFPSDNGSYPYTDCHMLRLADGPYNSTRSNKPFRYCQPGCTELTTLLSGGQGGGFGTYPGNSNWTTGSFTQGTWEVWQDRRGDVARSMFYMDLRYEGGFHGVTNFPEPDLILTDDEALIDASNTGSNLTVAYMGMLSVLIEWHQEDPPEAGEQARNDVVFGFQQNRNPFVDHPEWVELLYGAEALAAVTVPWVNELHYENVGVDDNEFVEIAGPATQDLSSWTLYGYDGDSGLVYATVPLSGSLPDHGGCVGALDFAVPGLQNETEGLALVDPMGGVVQFASYEGSFVAVDGPAAGMLSQDIGVGESSGSSPTQSLQLAGIGGTPGGFFWSLPKAATPGQPNVNQIYAAPAAVAFRNAGANPVSYASGPVVPGQTWNATVDLTTTGHTSALLVGYAGTGNTVLGSGQVVLFDPGSFRAFQTPLAGGPLAAFSAPIPDDPSLCGLIAYSQAVHLGGVKPFALSNAQDLVIGQP